MFKKILFTFLLLLIIFLGIEFGFRLIVKFMPFKFIVDQIELYKGHIYSEYAIDPHGSSIRVNGFHYCHPIKGRTIQRIFLDSKGFRVSDSKHFKKPGIKIGFFGDSFTEGLQVSEDKTFPRLLQDKLNERFSGKHKDKTYCFNFGFSQTGTYQQYLRYLTAKENVKLDYVVLGFLGINDIIDNHKGLSKKGSTVAPNASFMAIENGQFVEHRSEARRFMLLKGMQWITHRSYFLTISHRAIKKVQQMIIASRKLKAPVRAAPQGEKKIVAPEDDFRLYEDEGARAFWMGVYGEPVNKEWEDAWRITEETILRMADAVSKEGAKFVILLVTDDLQVRHPSHMDRIYDFTYFNRRLIKFAKEHGIDIIDSYPDFIKGKKGMTYPYYGWVNDGHYSEVGTSKMSEILEKYFIKELK